MFSFKNFLKKSVPAVLASALLFTGAAQAVSPVAAAQPAADTTVLTAGVLSSTVSGSAGSARSSSQMIVAENNLTKSIEQEAARKAEEAARKAAATYSPTYARRVAFTGAPVPSAVKAQGRNLGSFRLSFYCPCPKCCGSWADGITASGRYAQEGRTIAVDPRVIPLGSRVYIEGYGDFIAEDVGGAIKSKRIDVYLDSHSRCYQLGIDYANVYIL